MPVSNCEHRRVEVQRSVERSGHDVVYNHISYTQYFGICRDCGEHVERHKTHYPSHCPRSYRKQFGDSGWY